VLKHSNTFFTKLEKSLQLKLSCIKGSTTPSSDAHVMTVIAVYIAIDEDTCNSVFCLAIFTVRLTYYQ
jgi:hypothetical protein